MKLLFDQNLSPKLVNRLADLFPASSHVQWVGLDCASDDQVWERARLSGFAIVRKDEDFNNLSVVRGSPPKVIWLQLGNCTTAQVAAAFRARFAEIEAGSCSRGRGPAGGYDRYAPWASHPVAAQCGQTEKLLTNAARPCGIGPWSRCPARQTGRGDPIVGRKREGKNHDALPRDAARFPCPLRRDFGGHGLRASGCGGGCVRRGRAAGLEGDA